MKLMKRGAILAMGLVLFCTPLLRAQVLQQVPANAWVVLKVNNLKATSDKVAKLSQDLGMAAFIPQAADPLGALQVDLKIQQGLNTAGEFAFVYLDPASVNNRAEDAMLMLIPISDYKAFLSNWPDAKTTGDVSSVQLGVTPQPAFVANWGQYAAVSPSQVAVAKKPTGTGLVAPSVTGKELAQKDAVIYFNFNGLRPTVLPQIQQSRAQILAGVAQGFAGNPQLAKLGPLVRAVFNQMINGGEEFVKDAQAATIGLSLSPQGINLTVMGEFIKDSYIAQNVTATKNTDAPLIDGLPTGRYLMYGGSVSDPQLTTKLMSDIIDPVVKELLAIGPEMAPAQDYANALKAYVAATKGQSFGALAPSGQLGAEPLVQFLMVQKGDAKGISDSYNTMLNAQAKLLTALNVPGAESTKPTLVPKAKTVDGVSFDTMTTKVDPNAQNGAAMQQAQIMSMIYGPQGAVVNFGAVGTDKLLTASGVSDKMISSAIAATKANSAPLDNSEGVKAVASQLPKQRVAVLFVNVGDLVTSALGYAKQFGFAVPLQLPPELPPIGATASTEEGTALRFDVHIPTTLVQSLVAAAMQAQMQMQGGAGAPPAGL